MTNSKKLSNGNISKLLKIPTSSLSDALDEIGIIGFMDHEIKSINIEKKIVGPAITIKDIPTKKVETPLLALKAIDTAQKGDVVVRVVEGGDAKNIGLWGGLMATAAKHRGINGAILDGGFRDILEIRNIGFQIFSRSIVPSTSVRRTEVVSINTPVICGGIQVNPGDMIVGDADGVVAIPTQNLTQIIERAIEIDKIERLETEELKRGTPFIDTIKKFSRI